MIARFGTLWRRGAALRNGKQYLAQGRDRGLSSAPFVTVDESSSSVPETDLRRIPEQPVPLPASAGKQRPKVGVVLAAPRRRSLASLLPTPTARVPKRAIFAAGICAGLAVPGITRQLLARAAAGALGTVGQTAGPRLGSDSATLEVIRVTYTSPVHGKAASVLLKLVKALKR